MQMDEITFPRDSCLVSQGAEIYPILNSPWPPSRVAKELGYLDLSILPYILAMGL